MRLLTVVLDGRMFWRVHPSDPKLLELRCLPGWSLVNPLLNQAISKQSDNPAFGPDTNVTFVVEENIHLCSRGFYLALDDDGRFDWTVGASIEWERRLHMLIKYFRYASKQFSLNPRLKGFAPSDIDHLPSLVFPVKGEACATAGWPIYTSIDRGDVGLVSEQSLSEAPPTFDGMLQDAIEGLLRGDYKTAVLLAAIAMEALARTKLMAGLESAVDGSGTNPLLRIELFSTNDHQRDTKRKEELTDFFFNRARFEELIDGIALILIGKSLKLENKSLYDRAGTLYKQRNQIVHRGSLPIDVLDPLSGIDEAIAAVTCAIQLVEWFGELGGYANPFDRATGGVFCHTAVFNAN